MQQANSRAVDRLDADAEVRCVVVPGSDEAFAAGADIRSLREPTFTAALRHCGATWWPVSTSCMVRRRIGAREAERVGLMNEVAAEGEWLERAMELAQRIARRPPIAMQLAKQAARAADETGLTAGLEHERRLYELAMATEDRIEGMDAFLEKRRPQFRGR